MGEGLTFATETSRCRGIRPRVEQCGKVAQVVFRELVRGEGIAADIVVRSRERLSHAFSEDAPLQARGHLHLKVNWRSLQL